MRKSLKEIMEEMEKKKAPNSLATAKKKAKELLDGPAEDFVLIYLEKGGGGTVGAVRGHQRGKMALCVTEFMKRMVEREEEDDS